MKRLAIALLVVTGAAVQPLAQTSARKPLTVEQSADGWAVQLPAVRPSAISSVLVLDARPGAGR